MLSKEQVLEIISYCDSNGVSRKTRLEELGITHWEFYKSRKTYMSEEKSTGYGKGGFIQLESGNNFVPSSVTELENSVNPHRKHHVAVDELSVECQTPRGGIVRIRGRISTELLSVMIKNL